MPESNIKAKALKQIFAVAVDKESDIDKVLQKFPLQKAERVCDWIRRFDRSQGTECIRGPLTTGETECQRQFWIKDAQKNGDLEQDCVALNLQPDNCSVLECLGWIQGAYPI